MNSVKYERVVIDEVTIDEVTIDEVISDEVATDEVTIDAVTIKIEGKGAAQRSTSAVEPRSSLGDKVEARAAAVLEVQLERGSMPA